jgi:hypothetical protein
MSDTVVTVPVFTLQGPHTVSRMNYVLLDSRNKVCHLALSLLTLLGRAA